MEDTPKQSVLDADQIALLRDNADYCNARTRELLDRLIADYDATRQQLATAEAEAAGLVDRVVEAMQQGHETHFAAYVTNDEAFKLAVEASTRLAQLVKTRFRPSACSTTCSTPCQKAGNG